MFPSWSVSPIFNYLQQKLNKTLTSISSSGKRFSVLTTIFTPNLCSPALTCTYLAMRFGQTSTIKPLSCGEAKRKKEFIDLVIEFYICQFIVSLFDYLVVVYLLILIRFRFCGLKNKQLCWVIWFRSLFE